MYYAIKSENREVSSILNSLVALGYLTEVPQMQTELCKAYDIPKLDTDKYFQNVPKPEELTYTLGRTYRNGLQIEPEDNISCTVNVDLYLNNHLSLEANIKAIAKENLGVCEDWKWWKKDILKAAKEYGHDVILKTFYEWTAAQSTYFGKKPVSEFLRNVSGLIGTLGNKPQVTNPALDRIEKRIAYASDNQVFFVGEYRIHLAGLLKSYGEDLIYQAFVDFYHNEDPKRIPWASKNFLERAEVLISVIRRKKAEADLQEKQVAEAYKQSAEQVEQIEDEEEL